ncbi:hypothetical protein G7Z17_g4914 [Cylindrodendrum hubeiense]|uniref:Uncharacterized protein n=1 Tax=Cylindrodendrum hubeiense TaxID=595255 RepID=A0A9P5HI60_9HYPO|nr:hypothetical protein G7Z17_g4914 [Cylindrodendrum hubeiense]
MSATNSCRQYSVPLHQNPRTGTMYQIQASYDGIKSARTYLSKSADVKRQNVKRSNRGQLWICPSRFAPPLELSDSPPKATLSCH